MKHFVALAAITGIVNTLRADLPTFDPLSSSFDSSVYGN